MEKKCVGITAEYNPFHNGHLYHLEESRRQSGAEIVVCAMSGDFVQRGAPAIVDKWVRARMAVLGGADLVVEIPTVFACNAAPIFAASAVEILEELGADYISFGSEAGNIEALCEIARAIAAQEETLAESIRHKVKAARPALCSIRPTIVSRSNTLNVCAAQSR